MAEWLKEIVGQEWIEEDPAGYGSRVHPNDAGDVRTILMHAGENGTHVVTAGAARLLPPTGKPFILLDFSRLKGIEIFDADRIALCGAGVTNSTLEAALSSQAPGLAYSLPDEKSATVAESALGADCGTLAAAWGTNADMICAQELVLANGMCCRTGSASMNAGWFARGPLPDLSGITVGWLDAIGVVTRLSIKLYPKPPLSLFFRCRSDDPERLSHIAGRLSRTEIPMALTIEGRREGRKQRAFIEACFGAFSEKERDMKWKILADAAEGSILVEQAEKLDRMTDGGGELFVYPGTVGRLMKEAGAAAADAGRAVSFRISFFDAGHGALFRFNFEGSGKESEPLRKIMIRSIGEGAVPRRPDREMQQALMKHMNASTVDIMGKIKRRFDPKGILNPGLWEVAP